MNYFLQILFFLIFICFATIGWAEEDYTGVFKGYNTTQGLPITITVSYDDVHWRFQVWYSEYIIVCEPHVITWEGNCSDYTLPWLEPNEYSGTEFNCYSGGSLNGSRLKGTYDPTSGTWNGTFSWSLNTCSTGGSGDWYAKRPDPVVPINAIFTANTLLLLRK